MQTVRSRVRGEICSVGDARVDRLAGQARIAAHDLFRRKLRGQVVEHDEDGNPRPPEARLTVEDRRVHRDVVTPVYGR